MTIHYFGAGPARLPQSVLEQSAAAVASFGSSGLSILELEHRGPLFSAILDESTRLVKELCKLGDEYEVLWLPGGGRMQFCTVPMNYLPPNGKAGYIVSGHWAKSAMESAAFYGEVEAVASSEETGFTHYPDIHPSSLSYPSSTIPPRSYLHLTTNNTIYGTQLFTDPQASAPLVADMSSDILSMPRDYRRYAMFYAVAQKNLGAAGITLVCIRKDFLGKEVRPLPEMLSYRAHVAAQGVLNTPPVFAIYTCLLMLRWMKAQGLENIYAINEQKAALLYDEIARNPHFYCPVERGSRSRMNVVFKAMNEALEKEFLAFAKSNGIVGIAGHRSVGGFRASLYNAVSLQDVEALVKAMREFS